MTVPTALLFAFVLLLAGASGAAVLARLFRGDEADPGSRADAGSLLRPARGPRARGPAGLAAVVDLLCPHRPGSRCRSRSSRCPPGSSGAAPTFREFSPARARASFPSPSSSASSSSFLWIRWTFGEIRQTEKPMDFAVLSGLMTTARLPFPDPWLSGERFPYYHFGTYLFALPARAARVPSEFAYNLVAALLPALAALAGFGAIRARRGGPAIAVFGGLLLVLGGTFDGARQFLSEKPLTDLDWWMSSRRVDNPEHDHRVAALHVPPRRSPSARGHLPVPRDASSASRAASGAFPELCSTACFSRPSSRRTRGIFPRRSSSWAPATSPSATSGPRSSGVSRRFFPRRSFSCPSRSPRVPRSTASPGGRKGRAPPTPSFTSASSP